MDEYQSDDVLEIMAGWPENQPDATTNDRQSQHPTTERAQ